MTHFLPFPATTTATTHLLPYGLESLKTEVELVQKWPRYVRCFVQGCDEVVRTPGGGHKGEVCPRHGIRCHYGMSKPTYAYQRAERNIIASQQAFTRHIVGHPFKFESHRLGSENSEDALTWNVFRSLQEAGMLKRVAQAITGDAIDLEPFLYLWGIGLTNDQFEPWDLLIQARNRFEGNLPVERPYTEPDIALHLPGRYLILIEAKFTSANTFYLPGKRQKPDSLTLTELRDIYSDPNLKILDRQQAAEAPKLYQQLWRNTIFAEWMAQQDHPRTKAFHVNLVREGYDAASAEEFSRLVRPEYQERFQQTHWEAIYRGTQDVAALRSLHRYLEAKTTGLKKAFRLP